MPPLHILFPYLLLTLLLATPTLAFAQEAAPPTQELPQPEDGEVPAELVPEAEETDQEVEEEAPPPQASPAPAPAPQPKPPIVVGPIPKKPPNLTPASTPPLLKLEDPEAPQDDAVVAIPQKIRSEFQFASYGRVRGASDLEGGRPRPVNVVSFGSRIDELNYAELEFQQRFEVPGANPHETFTMQVVATLALGDDLFHYTGDFDQAIATRNLYAEGGWRLGNGLSTSFWAGSRMYRGDDIYLLDFWPLDNLNTVGGGGAVAYDWPEFGRTELKLHGGASRSLAPYQYQLIEVPGLDFGADQVLLLDRQRTILSARLQHDLWLHTRQNGTPTSGLKLVLYGESHDLPEGTRRLEDGLTTETLPAESGTKLGAELGAWIARGLFEGSFMNLFYAHTQDLAAYGEFGIPTGVNTQDTSLGASSHLLAISANLETPWAGMLLGAYYKTFADADAQQEDFDDYWESIFAARAHAYLTDHIHPGIELSYQVRQPQGPFARTNAFEAPAVTKLTLMQAISLQPKMYSRPQLRLLYTRSMLNDSALNLYAPEDPRRGLATQHYLGVMVEWWFNNVSLFRP